jgi:hypothetical protein
MAPKKVTVEYIKKDSTRRLTCKKRSMGVMKKAEELSTLCGVEVCLVISPEGEGELSKMQVWPSLREAASTVDRFRSMPEMDQCRKKMDAAGYVRERIAKAKELLSRAERENAQRETTLRVHEAMVGRRQNLDGLTAEQLVGVGWTTENLIKKIKDWIVYRGGQPTGVNADPLPNAATVADVEAPHLQQGWVMEVVDAAPCSGGSYGSVSAGADVMQLGNMDGGFGWWADPGTHSHHV